AAADQAVSDARAAWTKAQTNSSTGQDKLREHELSIALAAAQRDALAAVIEAERLESKGRKGGEDWNVEATNAVLRQREATLADSRLKQHQARVAEAEAQKKSDEAAEKVAQATNEVQQVTLKKDPSLTAKEDAAEKTAKALKEAQKKLAEADKALAEAET